MKRIKPFAFFLTFIVIFCISCSKTDNNNNSYTPVVTNNNNNNNNTPTYFFNATITGSPWDAVSPTATRSSSDTIIITGNADNQIITIKIPGSLNVGKNYTSASGVKETYFLSGSPYTTTTNTVALTISAISATSIVGTCSFTCSNPTLSGSTVVISGGSFDLQF